MPLFECTRCNGLTYSASALARACPACGAQRWRVLAETSFAAAEVANRRLQLGDHCAVVFGEDVTGAAAVCSAVIGAAVGRGEVVLCSLPDRLRDALDCPPEGITWLQSAQLYPDRFDPEALVAAHEETIAAAGRPVWFVVGPARPVAELAGLDAWRLYERLVHEVLARHEAGVVCLYDTTLNGEPVLDVCRETHPLLAEGEHAFAYAAA
jgi:predicted  nucleic acid-binding Zn-ribbon protein